MAYINLLNTLYDFDMISARLNYNNCTNPTNLQKNVLVPILIILKYYLDTDAFPYIDY